MDRGARWTLRPQIDRDRGMALPINNLLPVLERGTVREFARQMVKG